MFKAISFVNRAKDDTIFDIIVDNEWIDDCDKEKAFKVISEYEANMTNKRWIEDHEEWIAEVTDWFIAKSDGNVVMTIC